MSFRFKPSDFEGIYGHYQKELHEEYCKIANRLLDEHLETLPRVYNHRNSNSGWRSTPRSEDTDAAILWGCEPIPRPCQHLTIDVFSPSSTLRFESTPPQRKQFGKCCECGQYMEALWTENNRGTIEY